MNRRFSKEHSATGAWIAEDSGDRRAVPFSREFHHGAGAVGMYECPVASAAYPGEQQKHRALLVLTGHSLRKAR
jgi:hypothetical protein